MLAWSGFRRGSGLARATAQHGSDFSNLSLNALLPGLEANKGCLKDGVLECAHVAKKRVYTGSGLRGWPRWLTSSITSSL